MSREDAVFQASYNMDLSSFAALTFLIWDILITLDQEVDAVWSKPNNIYSKWLFLFVRYFAVAIQIALLFVGTQLAIGFHYTESDCIKWYIFQEVGTQLLVATVEFILIMRVHALYDRNRAVTMTLVVLFFVENVVMIVTLIKAVPGARFDTNCVVVHSPPGLIFFAVAFVSFETALFSLTLIKFLIALRNGWGRTPVLHLLVRDGTWAFILIFVTLCVNAGFYLGEGDSAIAAIAFPWLLSIESFAGARIVLNLYTISFDVSTDALGTSGPGTLSSHIVFTAHPSVDNRPRTPSMRWDWGGLQEYSNDERNGHVTRSQSGTGTSTGPGTESESYEMTWMTRANDTGSRKHGRKTNTSATDCTSPNTCSDTCVDVAENIPRITPE
ncbi:hypothetical protein BC826DRAFT_1032537 [Russula brevipes]|nr:hypothetical protein BC826DRAFT_1032537 [Russula brevipes]